MRSLILFSFLLGLTSNLRAQSFENIATSCQSLAAVKSSITAICLAKNGARYKSAIRLRGVNNVNGVLTVEQDSSLFSKFHRSCDNIAIDSYGIISARCIDQNKKYKSTQLDVSELIKNYNGTLVYP